MSGMKYVTNRDSFSWWRAGLYEESMGSNLNVVICYTGHVTSSGPDVDVDFVN